MDELQRERDELINAMQFKLKPNEIITIYMHHVGSIPKGPRNAKTSNSAIRLQQYSKPPGIPGSTEEAHTKQEHRTSSQQEKNHKTTRQTRVQRRRDGEQSKIENRTNLYMRCKPSTTLMHEYSKNSKNKTRRLQKIQKIQTVEIRRKM
jgi:hypothetical protein